MKKLFLAVAIFTASITVTKAQFYIGGGLGFWINNHVTSFSISPEAGYSFNNRWAVGLGVGLDATFRGDTWYTNANGSVAKLPRKSIYFYAEPYVRFNYFSAEKVNLFLDGVIGLSMGTGNISGFQTIIRPGIAINLTKHFSLVGTFGAFGYRQDYRNRTNGFGLNLTNSLGFGFYYSF